MFNPSNSLKMVIFSALVLGKGGGRVGLIEVVGDFISPVNPFMVVRVICYLLRGYSSASSRDGISPEMRPCVQNLSMSVRPGIRPHSSNKRP